MSSKRPPKRRAPGQLSLDCFRPQKKTQIEAIDIHPGSSGAAGDHGADGESVQETEPPVSESQAEQSDQQSECQSCVADSTNSSASPCEFSTEVVSSFDDVGILLERQGVTLRLSSEDKVRVLQERFIPTDTYPFPKVAMNGRNRSFRCSWLQTYQWLVYSKSQDGGYCLPCVLIATVSLTPFANRGVFVKTPFRRWTKVSEACRGHESLRYHLDAQVAYDAFKRSAVQPEETVAAKIDKRRAEVIAKNRALITSIAKTVYLCGKQGIALRGRRDDSMQTANPAANHGNFLELLRFRVEAGDLTLQSHVSTHCVNAAYSSKTVQNELIFVIGDHICNKIVTEVKQARYFSILADEVSDVAELEQLSIVLRFVDAELNIREEFVDFIEVERITGKALTML